MFHPQEGDEICRPLWPKAPKAERRLRTYTKPCTAAGPQQTLPSLWTRDETM